MGKILGFEFSIWDPHSLVYIQALIISQIGNFDVNLLERFFEFPFLHSPFTATSIFEIVAYSEDIMLAFDSVAIVDVTK